MSKSVKINKILCHDKNMSDPYTIILDGKDKDPYDSYMEEINEEAMDKFARIRKEERERKLIIEKIKQLKADISSMENEVNPSVPPPIDLSVIPNEGKRRKRSHSMRKHSRSMRNRSRSMKK